MIKARAKQKNIMFIKLDSPTTIDKRKNWGKKNKNFQNFPNGVFIKCDENFNGSHGVQPNDNGDAPKGWEKTDKVGFFDKKDIWIDPNVIHPNKEEDPINVVTIATLDGVIQYEIKEPSCFVFNMKEDGSIDVEDSWIQTVKELEKNYFVRHYIW
jgi:hypothetical protein